MKNYKVN